MTLPIDNNLWNTCIPLGNQMFFNRFSAMPTFNNMSSCVFFNQIPSFSREFTFDFNQKSVYKNFSIVENSKFAIFGNNLSISKKQKPAQKEKKYDNTTSAVNTSSWKNFSQKNGVRKINIEGSEVYACKWSKFSKSQPEWLGMQKYMIEAAEELGLTLVYSDMDRTVATSNACHAKKGSIVVKGGQSPHNYGVATDICLFKNGKLLSSKSTDFAEFAELVKEKSNYRITWGGDWNKKNEEHHFELTGWRDKYKKEENLIT